jgi:hypothetical protein
VVQKLRKYESCVYFIGDGEYIKIGYSQNVYKRLCSLQTTNPRELKILGIIPGDYFTERHHHKKFGHLRKHKKCEWFKKDDDILNYIHNKKDDELLKMHKEFYSKFNFRKDFDKVGKHDSVRFDNMLRDMEEGNETTVEGVSYAEWYDIWCRGPRALYYHLRINDDEESLFNDLNIIEKIKEDVPIGPGRKK